jgi:hypothetical protein
VPEPSAVEDEGMYSTIVVGVDGHPGGRDAIALAQTLGSAATDLVLVHVWKGVDGVMAAAAGAQPPVRAGEELLAQAQRHRVGVAYRPGPEGDEAVAGAEA